ncbi:MAG: MBOAT family protein [Lachnospiraceae bacterium]|nr:MBOAT family protein [Lachnospiraceae bacterium]
MAFSSMPFLCVFLPVVFLLYCVVPSLRMKNYLLIAASLLFYAYGEPVYVFLMIFCALVNYGIARLFDHCSAGQKKPLLVLALVLNLGMLGGYKYAGMAVETVNLVTNLKIPVPDIRLPIGISFFTFQALSYVIDVYRQKVEAQKRFSTILLYISFFPQLIAGPIIRYCDVAEQIRERTMSIEKVGEGLRRFSIGLSKKVLISNTMGAAADYVFSLSYAELGMPTAWIGAISYMLQIYFDFSGYSDMAIGLGKMFGFTFQENFRYPYVAVSMQDFWRRWHISLTDWFREYLYIPLGGNRKGKTRTWINRVIVFFCTGLWHGANWTFVIWGLFHGLFFILETLFPKLTTKMKAFRHIYVLLVVCVGFVIFRADNIGQALMMLSVMFTKFEWNSLIAGAAASVCTRLLLATFIVAVICALPVTEWIQKRKAGNANGFLNGTAVEILSYAGSVVLVLLCMMSLAGGTYNPFIYFRF